jgi:histidinol-phosphatase
MADLAVGADLAGQSFLVTYEADLAFAHRLADRAGAIAQRHLAPASMAVEAKSDGSPVTRADREIDKALHAMIRTKYPHDAFLGEESGAHGHGHRRWVVDAIDGTASFIAGEPEWSTLIALEDRNTPRLGLVSAPTLHRRWWAITGRGAWTRSDDPSVPSERLAVTTCATLKDAAIAIWPPPHRLSTDHRAVAAVVAANAGRVLPTMETMDWTRATPPAAPLRKPSAGSGTCHGALLVATGRLDAFLLLGAGRWDVAAVVPIVQEAGGAFSDLSGQCCTDSGVALFTNNHLHGQLLKVAAP